MSTPVSIDVIEAQRNHRAGLGAYHLAKLLRDNHGTGDTAEERALSPNEEHGLLLALEFITYSLYATLEQQMLDAEAAGVEQ
jgi:hypothetical protein